PSPMEKTNFPLVTMAVVLSSLYIASSLHKVWTNMRALSKISTIVDSKSGSISSYIGIGAYKSPRGAHDLVQEGYNKHRGAAFKISDAGGKWVVVVSGRRMVDDIRKAADDRISARHGNIEVFRLVYIIGPKVCYDAYHVEIIKSSLTRGLVERFEDVQSEVKDAFDELDLGFCVSDYHEDSESLRQSAICWFSMCRDVEYIDLTIEFASNVFKTSERISQFPDFLQPLVGYYIQATSVESQIQRAMAHLRPIIEERLEKDAEYGKDWPGRPNDIISWLLERAQGEQRTVRDITMRILTMNFAAIHSTSIAFTNVLFDLAAHPSFVTGLREEVERVIREEGLTPASFHKMVKLDSFIKESQRLGAGAVNMWRKVLEDFTFS
ncbi:Ent-kaurene oxidase, partial [Termitomyces sp. T112]